MHDLMVLKIEEASLLLLDVRNATDAKAVVDMAQAYETYAKRQQLSEEVIGHARAIKIDAMTLLGEFLRESARNLGGRPVKSTCTPLVQVSAPTLPEIGISRKVSATAQALVKVKKADPILHEQVRTGEISVSQALRALRPTSAPKHSPIIKPSDNWNFDPVAYPRIDDEHGHGYICGDFYVNVFWYFARPGDIIADLMAGSGMAQFIYDSRSEWMPAGEVYNFDLRLFDLNPRGPYIDLITKFDCRDPLPLERVNYIFCDVPYYAMVRGQYGDSPCDLANQAIDEWSDSMARIAQSCATVQQAGDRVTIVSPNFSDVAKRTYITIDEIIIDAFRGAGYSYYHRACASRHIQKEQSSNMARKNFNAKNNRTMMTDISYVLTFARKEV